MAMHEFAWRAAQNECRATHHGCDADGDFARDATWLVLPRTTAWKMNIVITLCYTLRFALCDPSPPMYIVVSTIPSLRGCAAVLRARSGGISQSLYTLTYALRLHPTLKHFSTNNPVPSGFSFTVHAFRTKENRRKEDFYSL